MEHAPAIGVYKISTFSLGFGEDGAEEEGVGSGGTARVPPGKKGSKHPTLAWVFWEKILILPMPSSG